MPDIYQKFLGVPDGPCYCVVLNRALVDVNQLQSPQNQSRPPWNDIPCYCVVLNRVLFDMNQPQSPQNQSCPLWNDIPCYCVVLDRVLFDVNQPQSPQNQSRPLWNKAGLCWDLHGMYDHESGCICTLQMQDCQSPVVWPHNFDEDGPCYHNGQDQLASCLHCH